MKHQILSPGMEHDEEANFGTEMFGVGGNGSQGFGSGPKENVVHHFLVLVSDGGNLFRESKDDMEILGVEELGLTIFDPLGPCQGLAFWAMAVAAGNGDLSITCLMGSNLYWGVRSAWCQLLSD